MPYLTAKGEDYLLDTIDGSHSAGTTGYDRVGVWGSVGGAADGLIGSVQTITWTHPTGLATFTEKSFTIPANTIVKGVMLFNSTTGVTYADALVNYELTNYETTVLGATFKISTFTYQFERGDI